MALTNYQKLLLSDVPLGYWPLDEASGTTAQDRADNDAAGTYVGSPSLASRSLGAPLGSVADFDGSNDQVTIANEAGLGGALADVTFEAWVIFDSVSGTRFIAEHGPHATDAPALYFAWVGGSSKFVVGWRNGTTYRDHDLAWTPSTATPYHLVATADGTTVRLYANGAEVASASQVGAPVAQSGGTWYLGSDSTSSNLLEGAIGHVAIYDYAMAPGDISLHHLAGIGELDTTHGYGWLDYRYQVLSDAPDIFWMLDEASGTVATDRSGNGHAGTITGSGVTYQTTGPGAGIPFAMAGSGIDLLNGPTDVAINTSPATLEVWAYPTATGAMLIGSTQSDFNGFQAYIDGSQKLVVIMSGLSTYTSAANFPLNAWAHLVLTLDGSTLSIYLNGALWDSAARGSLSMPSGKVARVGSSTYGGLELQGSIAGAAFYSAALPAAKVARHYLSGLGELDDYRLAVLQDSPAVFWPMEDAASAGTVADVSGAGRDGTVVSAFTQGATSILPVASVSADFPGTGDNYVERANDSGLDVGTGDFCFEAWMVCTNTTSDYVQVWGRDPAANNGMILYLNTGDGLPRPYLGGSGYNMGSARLSDSTLHHVVHQRRAGTLEVWVDGRLLSGATATAYDSDVAGSRNLRVGTLDGGLSEFKGGLSMFAYYTDSLSPWRIAAHYVTGLRTVYADLVADLGAGAYWPMNDAGTTYADTIGANDAAASTGTPLSERGFVPSLHTAGVRWDGASNALATSAAGVTGTDVTLQAWVRPPASTQGAWLKVGGGSDGWAVGQGDASNFEAPGDVGDNIVALYEGVVWRPSGASLTGDSWQHVVVVLQAGSTTFYVDGQLVASTSGGSRNSPSAETYMGGYDPGGGFARYWEGLEAHAATYNVALTEDEVRLLDAAAWWSYVAGGGGTDEPLGAIGFTGAGDLALLATDGESLVVNFTGAGDLDLELAVHVNVGVLDFTGQGDLGLTIRPRGAKRRTVVTTSEGVSYGEVRAQHQSITWELNRWEEASVVMPLDADGAEYVLDDEFREMQLWRGDQLLVFGPIVRPSTDGVHLTASVKGPAWHLSRRHVGKANRTNYVNNGDFEDGMAYWEPWIWLLQLWGNLPGAQAAFSGYEIIRENPVTGKRALRTENYVEGTANAIVQNLRWTVDEVENPDGDQWSLAGYVYVESYTAPGKGYNAVELTRLSTTELWDDPWVQSVTPGAMKIIQISGFRVDEDTPLGEWLPFNIDFTTPPKAGEPEDLFIQLRSPVGAARYDRISLTRVESTHWYQADQATIVGDLVEHAQDAAFGKDDVNIGVSTPATGVLRDLVLVHHEHPNIWNEIEAFTQLDNGIDVDVLVTPTTRTLRTHFPQKGRHHPELELRLVRNVASFAWAFDGEAASSSIIVLGTGNGSAREEAFAMDPNAFAGGLTLEEVFSAPRDTRIERLQPMAIEKLTVAKAPVVLAVKTFPHSDALLHRNFIGRLQIGDTCPVNITRGKLSVVGTYRAVRMTLNPDDTLDLVLNARELRYA